MSGDDDVVNCCPHCESSTISVSQERLEKDPDRAWFCGDCRTYFAEPDQRHSYRGSELTAQLAGMDPDDLPVRGSS